MILKQPQAPGMCSASSGSCGAIRPGSHYAELCSICGSAGLLRHDRTPKPAYTAFKGFTAETTPPRGEHHRGAERGELDQRPDPDLLLRLQRGRLDLRLPLRPGAFKPCGSPLHPRRAARGWRPHLLGQGDRRPGKRERGGLAHLHGRHPSPGRTPDHRHRSQFAGAQQHAQGEGLRRDALDREALQDRRLHRLAAGGGFAGQFASPGLSVGVAGDTTTVFRATATDAAGNVSPCSSGLTYVEDSTPPQTTITSGPPGPTTDHRPTFGFASSEPNSTFKCRFDSQPFAPCSGPGASHRPATPLSDGSHSFDVRATDRASNTDPTPANRTFTVDF